MLTDEDRRNIERLREILLVPLAAFIVVGIGVALTAVLWGIDLAIKGVVQ